MVTHSSNSPREKSIDTFRATTTTVPQQKIYIRSVFSELYAQAIPPPPPSFPRAPLLHLLLLRGRLYIHSNLFASRHPYTSQVLCNSHFTIITKNEVATQVHSNVEPTIGSKPPPPRLPRPYLPSPPGGQKQAGRARTTLPIIYSPPPHPP